MILNDFVERSGEIAISPAPPPIPWSVNPFFTVKMLNVCNIFTNQQGQRKLYNDSSILCSLRYPWWN